MTTPATDTTPPAPAGEYCAVVLTRLADGVVGNAAEFVDGHEVEPLHQLRIGTRKLRAALAFFAPLFHGDERLERAQGRLRRIALPFGQLRDLDVFLEHLDDGDAPVRPEDAEALRVHLVRRRRRLAGGVDEVVRSRKWRQTVDRIRADAAEGSWRSAPGAAVEARTFVAEQLDLWWWALLALSVDLAELPRGPRHRVRIEAKKLRYVTEVTADLFADREEERATFTAGLKEIQDELGELNDLMVAVSIVEDAGFEPLILEDPVDHTAKALAARAELIARGPYWSHTSS